VKFVKFVVVSSEKVSFGAEKVSFRILKVTFSGEKVSLFGNKLVFRVEFSREFRAKGDL